MRIKPQLPDPTPVRSCTSALFLPIKGNASIRSAYGVYNK